MPTSIGDILQVIWDFFASNAIIMLVFAAGSVVGLVVWGVKRISRAGTFYETHSACDDEDGNRAYYSNDELDAIFK